MSRTLISLPSFCGQRRDVGADPVGDGGRHRAAQRRRRRHRDAVLVRQHDRLEPHEVGAAAAAGPLDVGNARRDRDVFRQRQPASRRLRRRGRVPGRLLGGLVGSVVPGFAAAGLRRSAAGASGRTRPRQRNFRRMYAPAQPRRAIAEEVIEAEPACAGRLAAQAGARTRRPWLPSPAGSIHMATCDVRFPR